MVDSFILSIKSSTKPDGYSIVINKNSEQTTCSCDCPAGKFGKICKHVLAVLTGDVSVLIDPSQSSTLLSFAREIEASRIGLNVRALLEAESNLERAKKRVVSLRAELERAIREKA